MSIIRAHPPALRPVPVGSVFVSRDATQHCLVTSIRPFAPGLGLHRGVDISRRWGEEGGGAERADPVKARNELLLSIGHGQPGLHERGLGGDLVPPCASVCREGTVTADGRGGASSTILDL